MAKQWNEIKHKNKRLPKVPALQVAVYDMTGRPLSAEIVGEVSHAVSNILKKYDTLAHTIITE